MGKTSFALNLARNVAVKAKKKILFFSLEMTKEQLAQRVLSTEARVLSTKMRTGQLDTDDWTRLGLATASLNDCELYFDDTSTITVAEMKARARRLKNVDCIIIDYLGLIRSGTKVENRVQEVTEITRSLKLMAKDLNIPVICCAQLSRGTEGRGKSHRPQLSDLRESGSIEQDADIVLMLYREEYYKNESPRPPRPLPTRSRSLLPRTDTVRRRPSISSGMRITLCSWAWRRFRMLDKALSAVEKYNMLSPGTAVIAAVSGGADSMAMLLFLMKISERYSLSLTVAHVNRGICALLLRKELSSL